MARTRVARRAIRGHLEPAPKTRIVGAGEMEKALGDAMAEMATCHAWLEFENTPRR